MARTNNLTDFLSDVADAIRTKKGTSETIPAEDFDTEIENLPSGGDYNVKVDTTAGYGGNGGMLNLITEIKELDVSDMTSMLSMFQFCSNLKTLPQLDTSKVINMQKMFSGCVQLESIPLLDVGRVTNFNNTFYNCEKLTNVVFNNINTCTPTGVSSMFQGCKLLTHIDLRNFDFSNVGAYSNMFGSSASNGVPDDCEIIVADDTQKTWITSKFSRLTNVKTVAEYEAEQNA